jgi:toxin ParE1/3/4
MSIYPFTRLAVRDFNKIIDDLDVCSRTAARQIAGAIREQCERYSADPHIGILRDDLAPDLRCFMAYRYVVFYTLIPNGIEIARIFRW